MTSPGTHSSNKQSLAQRQAHPVQLNSAAMARKNFLLQKQQSTVREDDSILIKPNSVLTPKRTALGQDGAGYTYMANKGSQPAFPTTIHRKLQTSFGGYHKKKIVQESPPQQDDVHNCTHEEHLDEFDMVDNQGDILDECDEQTGIQRHQMAIGLNRQPKNSTGLVNVFQRSSKATVNFGSHSLNPQLTNSSKALPMQRPSQPVLMPFTSPIDRPDLGAKQAMRSGQQSRPAQRDQEKSPNAMQRSQDNSRSPPPLAHFQKGTFFGSSFAAGSQVRAAMRSDNSEKTPSIGKQFSQFPPNWPQDGNHKPVQSHKRPIPPSKDFGPQNFKHVDLGGQHIPDLFKNDSANVVDSDGGEVSPDDHDPVTEFSTKINLQHPSQPPAADTQLFTEQDTIVDQDDDVAEECSQQTQQHDGAQKYRFMHNKNPSDVLSCEAASARLPARPPQAVSAPPAHSASHKAPHTMEDIRATSRQSPTSHRSQENPLVCETVEDIQEGSALQHRRQEASTANSIDKTRFKQSTQKNWHRPIEEQSSGTKETPQLDRRVCQREESGHIVAPMSLEESQASIKAQTLRDSQKIIVAKTPPRRMPIQSAHPQVTHAHQTSISGAPVQVAASVQGEALPPNAEVIGTSPRAAEAYEATLPPHHAVKQLIRYERPKQACDQAQGKASLRQSQNFFATQQSNQLLQESLKQKGRNLDDTVSTSSKQRNADLRRECANMERMLKQMKAQQSKNSVLTSASNKSQQNLLSQQRLHERKEMSLLEAQPRVHTKGQYSMAEIAKSPVVGGAGAGVFGAASQKKIKRGIMSSRMSPQYQDEKGKQRRARQHSSISVSQQLGKGKRVRDGSGRMTKTSSVADATLIQSPDRVIPQSYSLNKPQEHLRRQKSPATLSQFMGGNSSSLAEQVESISASNRSHVVNTHTFANAHHHDISLRQKDRKLVEIDDGEHLTQDSCRVVAKRRKPRDPAHLEALADLRARENNTVQIGQLPVGRQRSREGLLDRSMGLAKSTYDRLQASQRQVKQRHIQSRGLSPRILNNKSTEVYETSTNRRAMRFEPSDDGHQQLRHQRHHHQKPQQRDGARGQCSQESVDHYADASSEGASYYGDETEYDTEEYYNEEERARSDSFADDEGDSTSPGQQLRHFYADDVGSFEVEDPRYQTQARDAKAKAFHHQQSLEKPSKARGKSQRKVKRDLHYSETSLDSFDDHQRSKPAQESRHKKSRHKPVKEISKKQPRHRESRKGDSHTNKPHETKRRNEPLKINIDMTGAPSATQQKPIVSHSAHPSVIGAPQMMPQVPAYSQTPLGQPGMQPYMFYPMQPVDPHQQQLYLLQQQQQQQQQHQQYLMQAQQQYQGGFQATQPLIPHLPINMMSPMNWTQPQGLQSDLRQSDLRQDPRQGRVAERPTQSHARDDKATDQQTTGRSPSTVAARQQSCISTSLFQNQDATSASARMRSPTSHSDLKDDHERNDCSSAIQWPNAQWDANTAKVSTEPALRQEESVNTPVNEEQDVMESLWARLRDQDRQSSTAVTRPPRPHPRQNNKMTEEHTPPSADRRQAEPSHWEADARGEVEPGEVLDLTPPVAHKKRGGEALIIAFDDGGDAGFAANKMKNPFAKKPQLKGSQRAKQADELPPKGKKLGSSAVKLGSKAKEEDSALDEKVVPLGADFKKISIQQIEAAEVRRKQIKNQGLIEIYDEGEAAQQAQPQSIAEAFLAKQKARVRKADGLDQDLAVAQDTQVQDDTAKKPLKVERTQKTTQELFEIRKAMMKKRNLPSRQTTDENTSVQTRTESAAPNVPQSDVLVVTQKQSAQRVQAKTPMTKEPNAALMQRLAGGKRSAIDKKEMKKLTKSNYENLPEIKRKKDEERKRQEALERQERIAKYNQECKARSRAQLKKKRQGAGASQNPSSISVAISDVAPAKRREP